MPRLLMAVAVFRDNGGASAAEYALILGIVSAAIAVGAYSLGQDISASLNMTAQNIRNCAGGC